MKNLMITAAALALATSPAFAQDATVPATDAMPAEVVPAENAETMPVEGAPMTTTDGTMTGGTMATDGAVLTTDEAVVTEGTIVTGDDTVVTDGTMTTAVPTRMDEDLEVALSAENQGITSSWLEGRAIYTTNQPSTTAWTDVTGDAVPGDWNEIANVSDLVMTPDGELIGYIADIGGFLGIGAHTVLLDRDALHLAQFGDDVVMATNYSQEELEALPEFDMDSVRD
nr:hypothetical protein [Paracoccus saliphilus]